MPKKTPTTESLDFGRRLVKLLEGKRQPRRGAGSYLAKRYKVSTVTANSWLNGEFKPGTSIAKQIADEHGSTFEELYFGTPRQNGPTAPISQSDATLTHPSPHQVQRVRVRGIAMVDGEGFWAEVQAAEQDEYVAALGNDPDAYAIKIVGRRYFPVIDSGQCVVASPAAPLKVHKRVLVRLADGRHTVRLYLNHEAGLWMFASLTDANEVLELRDDQVAAVERVVAVSDSE